MFGYFPGANPWMEQCPERGYGLRHVHDMTCEDGHVAGQCCECEGFPGRPVARPQQQVMPPLDVAARLKALGLDHGEDMDDMEDIHGDNTPVEPRLARGKWVGDDYEPGEAQGKPDGKGRGDLTFRQRERLVHWKMYILKLGGDDEPEPG